MKEAAYKRKMTVIAGALAAILVLAGAMAYFSYADGTGNERVSVEITENGTDEHGVNDSFEIIPGTEQKTGPVISATADCPAYVYAIVKDNTHDLVDYEIADGWTAVTGLTKVVTGKDRDGNEISIDPTEEGVKVYYREVSGTIADYEHGPWSVLKDDKVFYIADLSDEDMYNADGSTPKYDDISLAFSAYAIQKTPFDDPVKAWNQEVSVIGVTVSPDSISMKVGDPDQQLTASVSPDTATNKNVTWTSTNSTVATVDNTTGIVHAVSPGTATITATTKDGNLTDTCEVTVTSATGYIRWQVQLHNLENGTATFWPAMGTKNYGKHEHEGECICDHTWTEIASGNYDFTNCTCTKTVTIDVTKDTDIFEALDSDVTAGMLWTSLKFDARKWSTSGSITELTLPKTLAAMRNASDVKDVAGDFFLLSKSEVSQISQDSRFISNESGSTGNWWLDTPNPSSDGHFCYVEYVLVNGRIREDGVSYGTGGVAPGFTVNAN